MNTLLIRALRSSPLLLPYQKEPFGIQKRVYQNQPHGHLLWISDFCSFWSYEKKNFDAKVTPNTQYFSQMSFKLVKTFPHSVFSLHVLSAFFGLGVTTPGNLESHFLKKQNYCQLRSLSDFMNDQTLHSTSLLPSLGNPALDYFMYVNIFT